MNSNEAFISFFATIDAQELAIQHRASENYPINIEKLVKEKGIELQYANIISDGLVNFNRNHIVIKINSNLSHNRQRYTIAHEYGHVVLDAIFKKYISDEKIIIDSAKVRKIVEEFCNQFAAFLMIPDSAIKEFQKWENISIDNLQKKSRQLKISLTPLIRRVLEQAPYDSGFIWLKKVETKDELNRFQLVVEYAVFPKNKIFIKPNLKVPRDHLLNQYLGEKQEEKYENVEFKIKTFSDKRSILIKDFGRKVLIIVLPTEIEIKSMLKRENVSIFNFIE
jgi:Zn-dependent peptidase ImmA (M78 family)